MAMLVMGCFDFWGPATEGSERFSWKLILLPVLSLGNSSVDSIFTPCSGDVLSFPIQLSLFLPGSSCLPLDAERRKPLGRVRSTLLDRSLLGGPS